MYKKILFTSCLCVLPFALLNQVFAIGSCKIENGPIAAITQYNKAVDVSLTALRAEGTKISNCGITAGGVSASVDRTISIIDRAFLEISIFDNIFLDFFYNIKLAISGEARAPVMEQGKIFKQIEEKITAVLSSMTNQCNLTENVKKGFISLLQENQVLENIFKQTALGISVVPTGLSEPNITIANAIIAEYSVDATKGCQDLNGNQDAIEKLTRALTTMGSRNESALENWRIAIELFQGRGSNYTSIQRNLLVAEISRQGFPPHMAEAILKNFDCVKAGTVADDSFAATVKARAKCATNPLIRIEGFNLLPLRKMVDASKTTTERVTSVNQLSDTEKILRDITKTYSVLNHTKTVAIDGKSVLMSNLIDIHLELISSADYIEKRLQPMYRNCMKAQPGIPCPKP